MVVKSALIRRNTVVKKCANSKEYGSKEMRLF